jgi:hypothetical protein
MSGFFLFIRFLPVVSMFEIREIIQQRNEEKRE